MVKLDLSLKEGEILVKLARESMKERLTNNVTISPPKNVNEKLRVKAGVFVTLNQWGVEHGLRGCIGIPYPIKPLVNAVIEAAIDSATGDPRFPSVSLNELNDSIVIEVSVLTPPEEIKVDNTIEYSSHVEVGKDGLIVEKGMCKGLLLPQVAVEYEMDSEEFLSQCCMKAGLTPDTWLSPDVKIWKFQSLIFFEEKPEGTVHKKTLL